jgi:hypothetical protein
MQRHPYATRLYADSLRHWGSPLEVPEWDSWVLARPIGSCLKDAAGTYPIAILHNQVDLKGGLYRLSGHGLVSLVLVLDDFHRPPMAVLRRYFDHVQRYKTHYIYRPGKGPPIYSKRHRYQIRKATKILHVEVLELKRDLDAWALLYQNLIKRHRLVGLHAFPYQHYRALSRLHGVEAIGAWASGELVCCHVWINHDGRVHSHLMASSHTGYQLGAGYIVNDAALQHFRHAESINFGGGAGLSDDPSDGLAKFKKIFSNDTANSYVFGTVFKRDVYQRLNTQRNMFPDTPYFPAYRTPT